MTEKEIEFIYNLKSKYEEMPMPYSKIENVFLSYKNSFIKDNLFFSWNFNGSEVKEQKLYYTFYDYKYIYCTPIFNINLIYKLIPNIDTIGGLVSYTNKKKRIFSIKRFCDKNGLSFYFSKTPLFIDRRILIPDDSGLVYKEDNFIFRIHTEDIDLSSEETRIVEQKLNEKLKKMFHNVIFLSHEKELAKPKPKLTREERAIKKKEKIRRMIDEYYARKKDRNDI